MYQSLINISKNLILTEFVQNTRLEMEKCSNKYPVNDKNFKNWITNFHSLTDESTNTEDWVLLTPVLLNKRRRQE